MTLDEYLIKSKSLRVKHLIFPSGLELDIVLPSAFELIPAYKDNNVDAEAMLTVVSKKFPKGLTIDDLLPEDLTYLAEVISDFFASRKSPTGLDNTPES